jgi:hypothetical protein
MLTAVVNVSWSYRPVVEALRDRVQVAHLAIEDELHRDDVLFFLEETDFFLKKDHPYGSCYYLLEAVARYHDVSGPDRVEVVSHVLCHAFRQVYPEAPAGFERTGRMRQRPGGKQLWVEPLRDFITGHRVHLHRSLYDS